MTENLENLIDKLLIVINKTGLFNKKEISSKTSDSLQFDCKTAQGETYSFEIGKHISDSTELSDHGES